jgi:hypothetical protein
MFEDEILKQFLAKAVDDAKKEIRDTGSLTIKNAIPLLLHSQYNHILHLEEKMATKDDLKELEERIMSKIGRLELKIGTLESHIGTLDSKMGILESHIGTLDSKMGILESMIKSNRYFMLYGFTILGLVFTLLSIFVK